MKTRTVALGINDLFVSRIAEIRRQEEDEQREKMARDLRAKLDAFKANPSRENRAAAITALSGFTAMMEGI